MAFELPDFIEPPFVRLWLFDCDADRIRPAGLLY